MTHRLQIQSSDGEHVVNLQPIKAPGHGQPAQTIATCTCGWRTHQILLPTAQGYSQTHVDQHNRRTP